MVLISIRSLFELEVTPELISSINLGWLKTLNQLEMTYETSLQRSCLEDYSLTLMSCMISENFRATFRNPCVTKLQFTTVALQLDDINTVH